MLGCRGNARGVQPQKPLFESVDPVNSGERACRSDLGGADINGADFTNALLDKTQQIVRRMHPPQAPTVKHTLPNAQP